MDLRKLKDSAADYFKRGRFGRAAEAYAELCRREPREAQHKIKLGDSYRRDGKRDQAVKAYRAAVQGYTEQGVFIKAIAACKLVLELDPEHKDAQEELANLLNKRYQRSSFSPVPSQPQQAAGGPRSDRFAPIDLPEYSDSEPAFVTAGGETIEPHTRTKKAKIPQAPPPRQLTPPSLPRISPHGGRGLDIQVIEVQHRKEESSRLTFVNPDQELPPSSPGASASQAHSLGQSETELEFLDPSALEPVEVSEEIDLDLNGEAAFQQESASSEVRNEAASSARESKPRSSSDTGPRAEFDDTQASQAPHFTSLERGSNEGSEEVLEVLDLDAEFLDEDEAAVADRTKTSVAVGATATDALLKTPPVGAFTPRPGYRPAAGTVDPPTSVSELLSSSLLGEGEAADGDELALLAVTTSGENWGSELAPGDDHQDHDGSPAGASADYQQEVISELESSPEHALASPLETVVDDGLQPDLGAEGAASPYSADSAVAEAGSALDGSQVGAKVSDSKVFGADSELSEADSDAAEQRFEEHPDAEVSDLGTKPIAHPKSSEPPRSPSVHGLEKHKVEDRSPASSGETAPSQQEAGRPQIIRPSMPEAAHLEPQALAPDFSGLATERSRSDQLANEAFELSLNGSGEEQRAVVEVSQESVPLFGELSREAFLDLLQRLELQRHEPGDVVIQEGDSGRSIFILVNGSLRVVKGLGGEQEVELAVLEEGAFFGEMALLNSAPRVASVVAVEEVEVLELKENVLQELVSRHPGVADSLRRFYRQRLLANVMAISPIFASLGRRDRLALLERFKIREVTANTTICEEGEPNDGLYVVMHGSLTVSRFHQGKARELALLREGDIFGESSLLRQGTANATVTTQRKTLLLRLPRSDFHELIVTHPTVLEVLSSVDDEREKLSSKLLAEAAAP